MRKVLWLRQFSADGTLRLNKRSECKRRSDLSESAIAKKCDQQSVSCAITKKCCQQCKAFTVRLQETCGSAVLSESAIAKNVQSADCKRRAGLSKSAIAKKCDQQVIRVQETCGSAVLSESAIAKSAINRVQETCGSAVLSESAIAKKVQSAGHQSARVKVPLQKVRSTVRVQETCGSAVLSESAIAKKVQSAECKRRGGSAVLSESAVAKKSASGSAVLSESAIAKKVQAGVRVQETCGSAVLSESAIAKKVQSAGHQSARDVRECGTELKCRCKKSASGSAVLSESAIAKKVQAGVRQSASESAIAKSAINRSVSCAINKKCCQKCKAFTVRVQAMQPMGPVEGLKQSMTKDTESAMRSLKKIILKIGAEKRSPETGAPAKEYEAGQFYEELLNRTSTGNFPPNIGTRFVIPQDSNAPNYANEVMKVCSRIVTFCCQANTTEIDDVFQLGQFISAEHMRISPKYNVE
ncbi:hypothetical protein niasHT_012722 [Heterodera trifolii]|uniref:Uncharacterized protein n=1 Tax=Heterodera trifolii TaxID=157864 RepID=A0ABD2KWK9_9BILA